MTIEGKIDPELLAKAREALLTKSDAETIEEALRRAIVQREVADKIRALQGIGWEGDLDAMRRD